EEMKDGKRINTGKPAAYEVLYMGAAQATHEVARPYAYLLPASFEKVRETLQRHGIVVEELREAIELDVEVYRIVGPSRQLGLQKHQPVTLGVTPRKERRRMPAGSLLVRTAQPLSRLACFLLEPQSADGLATWNFFDSVLKEGGDFPVVRLPASVPLTAGRVRPLPPAARRGR